MRSRYSIPVWLRRTLLGITALLLLLASSTLFAQSCSLCYTQAASSTTRFIQALRSGILILMLPPMIMSIGFTVIAYRRRNEFHSTR
jgi:hypothetical protein